MKTLFLIFCIGVTGLVILSSNNPGTTQNNFSYINEDRNYVEGEIIVMFKTSTDAEAFINSYKNIDLEIKEVLVKDMNIYLFQYNVSKSNPTDALLSVMRNDKVAIAQFNHNFEERVVMPNDTRFAEQWDKNNTGQSGGTIDADIDGPEAWDMSTGGTTVLGDTIVVAIVDGGQQVTHQDLDTWRNWREIAANGIDDDSNGYIDDINGWNAGTNNGTIPANQHGTHCAGIVGAIGNNNIGVAGVNWKVKTMPIAYGSTQETNVLKAYGYVLKQRKLYNSTNGVKGSFIVSTNSSWGIDYGNPSNYPLWCAFYDSLGNAGILSAGAGPNLNVNIDVVGDMPTTCPSNFMIAVTNTTRTDLKNTGAGYGAINMDLGAPGTSILSTIPTNSYGTLTGTSMATPQVAGAVGLLYAGADSNFIRLAKIRPDSVAMLFKKFIMESVDTLASLRGITVSNGRLNVDKMLKNVTTPVVPVLNSFSLILPAAGVRILTTPTGTEQNLFSWDTSATGATYKFVFGSPTISTRKMSIPSATNLLSMTSAQLDTMLAGIGLNPGDSITGQWNVWSYRLLPLNDSLISSSASRSITFKRTLFTSLSNFSSEIPGNFSLSQNYPNPFNPSTNLEFAIPQTGYVTLKVYDMIGKEVAALVNSELNPGTYRFKFDGSNLSSGIYYYKLTVTGAEDYSALKRMVLIK
ncbi:MAG TPA: S8 family serine peptidase [Ignavibacteria bacterium]|nr:S8 family serine peptidase [Ignavibacteria bacterium]